MTPVPGPDYLDRFSAALVSEIKAEMGRRDLSSRGLAALLGENPQYVTSRIGAGNPRTGKRVPINIVDLVAIAGAFELEPALLFGRAMDAASEGGEDGTVSVLPGTPDPYDDSGSTLSEAALDGDEEAGASEFDD